MGLEIKMYKNCQHIIRPKKIVPDYLTLSRSYGKFIIEPLENGYGITLGNSLRRILLSSLVGCAITSIYIKNITHEYMSLSGIKEETKEIIINLKSIQILLYNTEFLE